MLPNLQHWMPRQAPGMDFLGAFELLTVQRCLLLSDLRAILGHSMTEKWLQIACFDIV